MITSKKLSLSKRHELEDDVYRALVETLFTSTTSLALGALVGSVASGCIAYISDNVILRYCTAITIIIGIVRIVSFKIYNKKSSVGQISYKNWENIYEYGAWLYAFVLGINGFFTLILTNNTILYMMAATLNVGYTAGIASRNAGRPKIALGQVLLCTLPLTLGFLARGDFSNTFMGCMLLLGMLTFINISKQTYNGVLLAFIEKHEKSELASQYEILAKTDALTGLQNRLTLTNKLEFDLAHSASNDPRAISVFWIDLDKFKEINDNLGHSAGDFILKEVALRLKNIAGSEGYVARFGGDEFVIVMRCLNPLAACIIADKVVAMLAIPVSYKHTSLDISGSVGVAISNIKESMVSEALIQNADIAMYEAKKNGRNRYAIFDVSMSEHLVKRREMEADIKKALGANQFEILYQPIVDIRTAEVVSYEALLRWHHPVHGTISPSIFIPVAEDINLIEPITMWVIETACKTAKSWPENIKLNVNISPTLLKTRNIVSLIHTSLVNSGLRARQLCLEITESLLIDDNVNAYVMLKEFKRLGISLALDDFGTGYSSLSYVCKYSFDTLKIDQSFTSNLTRHPESRAVIDAVVGLSNSLKIGIVAEGIETEDDRLIVEQAGCNYAQGYLFGRPQPAHLIYHLTQTQADVVRPLKRVRAKR